MGKIFMGDYSRFNKVSIEIKNQIEEKEHFHQDIELIYVLDGYMTVEVGEQKSELKVEDVLVINANKKHRVELADKNALYMRLEIAYPLVSDVLRSIDIMFFCDSSKENDERYNEIRKWLKKLLGFYLTQEQNVASFRYISLCYKILDTLASCFRVQLGNKKMIAEGERFEERIMQINNYIRSNYAQNISLKDLSEKLYLSIGYLSRFFKKNYKMNFADYLKTVRLYHAADELLYTNVPITRVAYDNGFASAAVFNKAFKESYGDTPSAFRKKAINDKQPVQKEIYDKDIEQRLLNILGEEIEQNTDKSEEHIEVSESVKSEQYVKPIWNRLINIGSASDMLSSEIREHIILLKGALGIEYIRFWNIFSQDMLLRLSEGRSYNFTRLDSILDFLIQNDIKPHIELGGKPKRIQKNAQSTIENTEKEHLYPLPAIWEEFLHALMKHLVLRYGREQTEQWRMELWWDERILRSKENKEKYIRMFHSTYKIIKSYSPHLEVGGYGLRGNLIEEDNILDLWETETIKPDFISTILYGYTWKEENGEKVAKRDTDMDALKQAALAVRERMNCAGLQDTKLYITEWNLTVSDRNYINDTCFKGAYIIKNYLDFYDIADIAAYFEGSDRIAEHYDSNSLLYGGMGVLSKDGILKPAGFAFEFLNRLYPYFVGKGNNYIITSDGNGAYGILCHNMRNLNYNYYLMKEDELEKDQIWKYSEDKKKTRLNILLQDVEEGVYQQKTYRVNEDNGNILGIWGEMKYIRDIDREEVKYFRKVCEPKMMIDTVNVTGHEMEVNLLLEPNEIMYVKIRKIG